MAYFRVFFEHPRLLAFGFLFSLISSFGQTYFIALFGETLRTFLDLDNAHYGYLYSAATLTSALLLPWVGRLIDRVDLRWFASLVCLGLAAGGLLLASVPSVPLLFAAFLALRLFGQGLSGHTSTTTMARYFELERGKAISLASLGFPVGEATLPLVVVTLLAYLEWRSLWIAIAIFIGGVVLPLSWWLLRKVDTDPRSASSSPTAASEATGWTTREVIKSAAFYLVLPAVLVPPFIGTAVFFHSLPICTLRGWPVEKWALGLSLYASCSIGGALLAGTLVDRLSGRALISLYLVPQVLSLLLLASTTGEWTLFGYVTGAGLSAGAGGPIVGALWAEWYGVRFLGSIRSLVFGVVVFSTACAPGPIGGFLDRGTSVETLALSGAIGTGLSCLLAAIAVQTQLRRGAHSKGPSPKGTSKESSRREEA